MKMLSFAAGAVACALVASPAVAGVVFTDNFDSENGGVSSANYAAFANWTVKAGQHVDLIHDGDLGTTGSGSYVELADSLGPGQIFTNQVFSYQAGDRITIDFDMSGSQRSTASDLWYAGLFDLNPAGNGATNRTVAVTGVPLDLPDLAGVQALTTTVTFLGVKQFDSVEVAFNVSHAGSGVFFFGSTSTAGVGPLLDNVKISIDAVPEPASWALMIAGFGLEGTALRRRRMAAA